VAEKIAVRPVWLVRRGNGLLLSAKFGRVGHECPSVLERLTGPQCWRLACRYLPGIFPFKSGKRHFI